MTVYGRFVDKKLVFDNDRINLATRFLVYIGVAQRQRGDGICVYTGFLFDFFQLGGGNKFPRRAGAERKQE